MKKILSAVLAAALLFSLAVSAGGESEPEWTAAERQALDLLAQSLEKDAERQMATYGEVTDLYTDLIPSSPADTGSFPEKFDLRDRGILTPIKSQSPWGTCWTFGTSAACETSLLSMLGLTAEGYREKFGVDMDLSERHLAWFTAIPLPELSDFPEGEYPYDPSQAGEGTRVNKDHPLMGGGTYLLSASSLAAGVGVVGESLAPYQANKEVPPGEDLRSGDWSLPEEYRFIQSFQLKNTNVLPSPAGKDENGGYVFRPEAIAAIKRELVSGRGVAAAYVAGSGSPDTVSKEERRAQYEDLLMYEDALGADKETLIGVLVGDVDPETLPDEMLRKFIQFRSTFNGLDEGTYALSDLSHEDLALLAKTPYMVGTAPDEIRRQQAEAEEKRVLFFIGKDPVIWAQYSDKTVMPDHATCIVGWDDTFPASSFPENHRPPADGAWLCRNSYGKDWGMEGYFYLSYYDRSFGMAQTFEFADDEDLQKLETFGILQYDYMPAEMISATLYDAPVYAANVFTVSEDKTVLRYVSAMTREPDTQVTASVWLLAEGAASPTDGKLLATVTDTFSYAGYHRMGLAESLLLPAGARVAVTVLQCVPDGETVKYALVNTSSQGEKSPKNFFRWYVGVVNPGESYVSFEEGRWLDWRTVLDRISGEGNLACIAYDNLPVKGYVYSLEELSSIHDLDARIPTAGGEAAICPDCGYVLEIPEP